MPKWVFHHTTGAFTAEEKQQIAYAMTKLYPSVGLPAFYAHTHFIEFSPDSIYAGWCPYHTLGLSYRLNLQHARNPRHIFKTLDGILRPILKPKGIEWDIVIYEANRDYGRVNGLIPPPNGSDLEKKWFANNTVTGEEELLKSQPHPQAASVWLRRTYKEVACPA